MSYCPYLINNDKQIILIYSKKSGCTSLVRGFIENICGIKDKNYNHKIINDNKLLRSSAVDAPFLQMKWDISINYNLIPKNYKIFWGIRDPRDRIISCFINKFIFHPVFGRVNKNNLESFSKEFLESININYEKLTFNKFLEGIEYLKKNKKHINHHFNNQVNKDRYNLIKDLPNLLIFDINNIPNILKIDNQLNKTQEKQDKNKRINCSNVKVTEFKNYMLTKSNYYDSSDLIKKIFDSDYKIFSNLGFLY